VKERGTLIHLALFAASALLAITLWAKDKKPKGAAVGDVVVWAGRAADVTKVTYEHKKGKTVLDVKSDAGGRFFVGRVEKVSATPEGEGKNLSFVSVGPADKLVALLAPFKAFRAIGRVGAERNKEFGFDGEELGQLTVVVGGAEKKLSVGGGTSGGGDRYARDDSTGELYAIEGDIIRDLEQADLKLVERDLHEWKDSEVGTAKIAAGDKTRDFVRGGAVEGKRFWAQATSPEQNDETAGNFMSKVDKLKPSEYAEQQPPGSALVLRIDYAAGSKPIGFLEILKVPAEGEGKKPTYWVRSERTRWFGKVVGAGGEQVEADLAGIVR